MALVFSSKYDAYFQSIFSYGRLLTLICWVSPVELEIQKYLTHPYNNRSDKPGPSNLLKIVRCCCKEACDKRCSYRKAVLNCTSTYKKCYVLCDNNAQKIDECNDNDCDHENVIDTRYFLDTFFQNNLVISLFH